MENTGDVGYRSLRLLQAKLMVDTGGCSEDQDADRNVEIVGMLMRLYMEIKTLLDIGLVAIFSTFW